MPASRRFADIAQNPRRPPVQFRGVRVHGVPDVIIYDHTRKISTLPARGSSRCVTDPRDEEIAELRRLLAERDAVIARQSLEIARLTAEVAALKELLGK